MLELACELIDAQEERAAELALEQIAKLEDMGAAQQHVHDVMLATLRTQFLALKTEAGAELARIRDEVTAHAEGRMANAEGHAQAQYAQFAKEYGERIAALFGTLEQQLQSGSKKTAERLRQELGGEVKQAAAKFKTEAEHTLAERFSRFTREADTIFDETIEKKTGEIRAEFSALAEKVQQRAGEVIASARSELQKQFEQFSEEQTALLAITFRGNWDNRTKYKRGQTFTFRGQFYLVLRGCRDVTPTKHAQEGENPFYKLLAASGAPGLPGQGSGSGSGDMVLSAAQTNTGAKTFLDTTLLLRNVADTFNGSFTNTNTADRIYTLKDADGTLAFTSDITGINSGTNTGDQAVATAAQAVAGSSTSALLTPSVEFESNLSTIWVRLLSTYSSSVSGSGSTSTANLGGNVTTGATAGSTARLSITNENARIEPGVPFNYFNWSKKKGLFVIFVSDLSTAAGIVRMSLGQADDTTTVDRGKLISCGIGFELRYNALWGVVHDGTTYKATDLSTTVAITSSGTTALLAISDGAGNVAFYVNGIYKATSTGGPTNTSAPYTTYTLAAVNDTDAASVRCWTNPVRVGTGY